MFPSTPGSLPRGLGSWYSTKYLRSLPGNIPGKAVSSGRGAGRVLQRPAGTEGDSPGQSSSAPQIHGLTAADVREQQQASRERKESAPLGRHTPSARRKLGKRGPRRKTGGRGGRGHCSVLVKPIKRAEGAGYSDVLVAHTTFDTYSNAMPRIMKVGCRALTLHESDRGRQLTYCCCASIELPAHRHADDEFTDYQVDHLLLLSRSDRLD